MLCATADFWRKEEYWCFFPLQPPWRANLALVNVQKRTTKCSHWVKGNHPSPLFRPYIWGLCLLWGRKPPDIPSDPNYPFITKVLPCLTPCIACFITHNSNRGLSWGFTMNFIGEGSARQQRVEHGLELITGSCSATRDAQRGAGRVKPGEFRVNSGECEGRKYCIVGKILRLDIGLIQRRVF